MWMFWTGYQLINHVDRSDMKFFLYAQEIFLWNIDFSSSVIAHFEALKTLTLNMYNLLNIFVGNNTKGQKTI